MAALLSALLLGSGAATALDPKKPIPYYKHEVWQAKDELPHQTIQAILQTGISSLYEDRDGHLWIGASGAGLFRWIGGQFLHYTAKDALPAKSVQSIYQDREGTLWIGTLGSGLARLSNARFSAFSARDGFSDQNVLSITGDREGNLWIGTEDGLNKLSDLPITMAFGMREGPRSGCT